MNTWYLWASKLRAELQRLFLKGSTRQTNKMYRHRRSEDTLDRGVERLVLGGGKCLDVEVEDRDLLHRRLGREETNG